MISQLINFLKALEEICPPPVGCHHLLMFARYGSDELGWEDKLLLQVNVEGRFFPFFLEEEDFSKTTTYLVKEVTQTLAHPIAGWQISYTAGKAGDVPEPVQGVRA